MNNGCAGMLPILLGSGEQHQAHLNYGEPPGFPSKWKAWTNMGNWGSQGLVTGYLSSRQVFLGSQLCSSRVLLELLWLMHVCLTTHYSSRISN